MKIFQLIDLIIKLFKLNKRSKVVLLFLIPTFLLGQNQAFWLGKRTTGAPTNLLLDDYPGAAVAYSVRKLDKDYTGFAMEIRRASDNATQNIGFVGENLDVTSINIFCSGTTCYVQTWYDQSGNGRDAIKTTLSEQAIIYENEAIITENNKPAIKPNLNGLGYNTTVSGLSNFAILAVGNNTQRINNGAGRIISTYSGAGSPSVTDLVIDQLNNLQFRIIVNGTSTTNVPSGIDFVLFANRNSTSNTISLNNDLYTNSFTTSFSNSKTLYLFEDSGGPLNGEILRGFNEFIIYNTSQLANKIAFFNNINSYYSIY